MKFKAMVDLTLAHIDCRLCIKVADMMREENLIPDEYYFEDYYTYEPTGKGKGLFSLEMLT